MKNHQIKQAEVDGIIIKKILQNISTRGRFSEKIPLPSALRITYNGTVYMFIIWLEKLTISFYSILFYHEAEEELPPNMQNLWESLFRLTFVWMQVM